MKPINAYKIAENLNGNAEWRAAWNVRGGLDVVLDAPMIDLRDVTDEQVDEAYAAEEKRGDGEVLSPISRLPWPAVTLHLGSHIIFVDSRFGEDDCYGGMAARSLEGAEETGWSVCVSVSHLNPDRTASDEFVLSLLGGLQFVEVDGKYGFATVPAHCVATSPYMSKEFPVINGEDEVLNGMLHELQAEHVNRIRDAMTVINAPHNNVVEVTPTKLSKRAKKAKREGTRLPYGCRPRMVVIPRSGLVKRYKNSHGMTGADRMPHFRRGHLRTLTSDRYVNKQGQRIWVKPTTIGEPDIEWHEKALAYRVIS